MLRRANRLWALGERVVALALLPVLLVGTSPQVICVCASGQRMPHCPTLAKKQAAVAPAAVCCQSPRQHKRSACCQARRDATADPCKMPAGQIDHQSSGCCHAVIEAAPPTIAHKPAANDSTSLAAAAPVVYIAASQLWPVIATAERATPPPGDIVILCSRLTI
jgi:hypothetical protein